MRLAATRTDTVEVLGYTAIGAYVLAVVLYVIGAVWDLDQVRDGALALGLLGLALDVRWHTAHGVHRLIHSMSLWQDYDNPPQHRKDLPQQDDTLA